MRHVLLCTGWALEMEVAVPCQWLRLGSEPTGEATGGKGDDALLYGTVYVPSDMVTFAP